MKSIILTINYFFILPIILYLHRTNKESSKEILCYWKISYLQEKYGHILGRGK